jgi:hypothetical protein
MRKISPFWFGAERPPPLKPGNERQANVRGAWRRAVGMGEALGDLILAHANDLGGLEMLSEAQISICRRDRWPGCMPSSRILKTTFKNISPYLT